MADQRLSKRTVLPDPLIADMVYFIKGASDTKTMIYVTTTTMPITAIPIAYVSDAELTLLLAGKQDKFTGNTTQYVRGDGSLATHDKASVGLSLIPNLAPADWPVSTATTNELNTKIPLTQKGALNGVATLDAGGKVPAAQLPSYVDDVLEFANLAAFPASGETGKMYVALDTNMLYRWSGSIYIKISSGDVTEMANFFVRYDAAQSLTAPRQAQARTNIGALGTADLAAYATIAASDAKYVRFDAAQSLTTPQQTQARNNIGAAPAASLAGYLPLTGGTLTGPLAGTTGTFTGKVRGQSSYVLPAVGAANTAFSSGGFESYVNTVDRAAGARPGIGFHAEGGWGGYLYQNGDSEIRLRSLGGGDWGFWHTGNLRSDAQNDVRYPLAANTYNKTEVNNLVNAANQWEATAW